MRAAFAASLALGFGLTAAGGTQAFEVTSPGYKPGDRVHSEQVFNDLGCTGRNLSPALAWKDPPKARRAICSPSTIQTRQAAPDGGIGWSTTFPPMRAVCLRGW